MIARMKQKVDEAELNAFACNVTDIGMIAAELLPRLEKCGCTMDADPHKAVSTILVAIKTLAETAIRLADGPKKG